MNNLFKRKQGLIQKRIIASLFLLLCFLGTSYLTLNIKDIDQGTTPKTINDVNNNYSLFSSDNQGGDNPSISISNASQYDVSESVIYQSNKSVVNMMPDLLSFDVPQYWTANFFKSNINSIFYTQDLLENDNGNFNLPGEWSNSTLYPWYYGKPDSESWVNYSKTEYEPGNYRADLTFNSPNPIPPSNYYGYLTNDNESYSHLTDQVDVGELFEPLKSEYPINNHFNTNPNYNQLIGTSAYSRSSGGLTTYDFGWISSEHYIFQRMDIKSLITFNDPSMAYQTTFYIPFEPDSVTITYSWAVNNLGYEAIDKFQVKSRINGVFVDGSGYYEGTTTSLEDDFVSGDVNSHPWRTQTYNITNLLGVYTRRMGWHTLDFGLYMECPSDATDDVKVDWDYIMINAVHYDWYKAATVEFDYILEDLIGGTPGDQTMCMAIYFGTTDVGSGGGGDTPILGRFFINTTDRLSWGTWNTRQHLKFYIPQTYVPFFQVNKFRLQLGLEFWNGELGGTIPMPKKFVFRVDNINISINWILQGAPDSPLIGLYGRLTGTGEEGWMKFASSNETNINLGSPGFSWEFKANGTKIQPWMNPKIRISSSITVVKYSSKVAFASLNVTNFSSTQGLWNITYNNTISVNEFDNTTFRNVTFYQYNFTIVNLPAFDGKGKLSSDWFLHSVYSPSGVNKTSTSIKTSTNPYLQNGTVINATSGTRGSLQRGVWWAIAYQDNYMTNGSLAHIGYSGNENIYYHNNNSFIDLRVRNSTDLTANYSIAILNSSLNIMQSFPMYLGAPTLANTTLPWTVKDEGSGICYVLSLWNDTSPDNQTKRFGWYRDIFYMYRNTTGRIISYNEEVPFGDISNYELEFNATLDEQIGVTGANIYAYNAQTNNLWGLDWAPYTYLVEYLNDNGNGRYSIGLKTRGVPFGNYTIYFKMVKIFYNTYVTETINLNLTIIIPLNNMTINYLSGGFNISESQGFLTSSNIPLLNDTSHFIIQFFVNDSLTGNPLRDVYITARFNGSSNLMVAIEQYAYSHLESDKGKYNLTLNTMDLHATDDIEWYNYTLQISFACNGYNPKYQQLSCSILPIPLHFEALALDDVYEGDPFTIESSLYLDTLNGLVSCNFATMMWSLYNESGYLIGNYLIRTISNYYQYQFTTDMYLYPGNYWIILNATGLDVETSYSSAIPFEVFAKFASVMGIIFPAEVRIGGTVNIAANLTYINGDPIGGKDITLTINYSATYSYQVTVQTTSDGRARYEFLIPQYYEGEQLTVVANFTGSGLILPSWAFKSQEILGKIPVNITFTQAPEYVQVGYNATYSMNISILGRSSYEGIIIYLFAFYDEETQPFQIQQLSTTSGGSATYTIPEVADSHYNLTVYFQYLGDEQTKDQFNFTTSRIIGKWNSTISLKIDDRSNQFPDIIRYGQTLNFNITLIPVETQFSESFVGLPISVFINYSTGDEFVRYEYTYYLNVNSSYIFNYEILSNGYSQIEIMIVFSGTIKIKEQTIAVAKDISPKKTVNIEIQSSSIGKLLKGTYFYSMNLSDNEGIPLTQIPVLFRIYDASNNLIDELSGITNEQGVVSIQIDMSDYSPGDYQLRVIFLGQGIYQNAASEPLEIELTTYFLIFVDYLPYILGAIAVTIATIFIMYRTVVIPRRIKRMEALKRIHQRFEDVENIQYILILYRESGLTLYSRSFTNLPIDADLISGFLTAISSFGAEIGAKMEKKPTNEDKGLEQLSYKQFKIIVNDVALVRTAILLLKDASPTLKENLKKFNFKFQEKYMDVLQNWNGQVMPEGPTLELIEKQLDVDLLYPHNVNASAVQDYIKTLDKKSIEKLILDEAARPKFNNTFKIRDMINHLMVQDKREVEVFNGIDTLRKERIVYAVNPRTMQLIEQFRPVIERIPADAKKVLLAIAEGNNQEIKLRKIKGIEKLDESIAILQQMNLIDSTLKLSEIGEAITTLMRLMPNL